MTFCIVIVAVVLVVVAIGYRYDRKHRRLGDSAADRRPMRLGSHGREHEGGARTAGAEGVMTTGVHRHRRCLVVAWSWRSATTDRHNAAVTDSATAAA